jgi:hypothetical protein
MKYTTIKLIGNLGTIQEDFGFIVTNGKEQVGAYIYKRCPDTRNKVSSEFLLIPKKIQNPDIFCDIIFRYYSDDLRLFYKKFFPR